MIRSNAGQEVSEPGRAVSSLCFLSAPRLATGRTRHICERRSARQTGLTSLQEAADRRVAFEADSHFVGVARFAMRACPRE